MIKSIEKHQIIMIIFAFFQADELPAFQVDKWYIIFGHIQTYSIMLKKGHANMMAGANFSV